MTGPQTGVRRCYARWRYASFAGNTATGPEGIGSGVLSPAEAEDDALDDMAAGLPVDVGRATS